MIEIRKKTEEKCESCENFCPETRNLTFYTDGKTMHVTELYCGHQELCDGLEKFLRKMQEVNEQ